MLLAHVFAVGLLLGATSYGGMRQYRTTEVNVNVYDPTRQEQLKLQRQALELQRQSLQLQRQANQRQWNNDRDRWETQTQDRDNMLTDQALSLNDGKCADYFNGVRCQLRATNNGFCARHYRELQKGEKELKYKRASRCR